MAKQTRMPLRCAKFHANGCNESSLKGGRKCWYLACEKI